MGAQPSPCAPGIGVVKDQGRVRLKGGPVLLEEFQAVSQGQGKWYFGPWSRLPPLGDRVRLRPHLGRPAARSPEPADPLSQAVSPQEQRTLPPARWTCVSGFRFRGG